jgi:hypothetical protein
MLLLNSNLVFEVVSVKKEKKRRLREWGTIGSKAYMGGSCLWF